MEKKKNIVIAFLSIIGMIMICGCKNCVNLGLPSGTKWATHNLGAKNPEDYGDYFSWGETSPKPTYIWDVYKYSNGKFKLTKYCSNIEFGNNGFTDTLVRLQLSDDAATCNWGKGWRMPTMAECIELQDKCKWEWSERNGKKGYIVTGANGKSIFLPAAGYRKDDGISVEGSQGHYWSSSLMIDYSPDAWYLRFKSDNVPCKPYHRHRYYGYSIRPVRSSVRNNKKHIRNDLLANISAPTGYSNGYGYVDLGLPSGIKWATCNVGANNIGDYGDYFAWGEVSAKSIYHWNYYIYCKGETSYRAYNALAKYCNNSYNGNNGFVDNLIKLQAKDDVATVIRGNDWHIPTKEDFEELKNMCIWEMTASGCKVTGPNGNSIFLPAAGIYCENDLYIVNSLGAYWSCSLDTTNAGKAYILGFVPDSCIIDGYRRDYGLPIRPVCTK